MGLFNNNTALTSPSVSNDEEEENNRNIVKPVRRKSITNSVPVRVNTTTTPVNTQTNTVPVNLNTRSMVGKTPKFDSVILADGPSVPPSYKTDRQFNIQLREQTDTLNEKARNYNYIYGRTTGKSWVDENPVSYYKTINDNIKSGSFGKTLQQADTNTNGVSTAIVGAVFAPLASAFNITPEITADVSESIFTALDKVFGDIGPDDGLFGGNTPEEAAQEFNEMLEALLIGVSSDLDGGTAPGILEALPQGMLVNAITTAAKQKILRQIQFASTAQFKRANGTLKIDPDAQRIQMATREESLKKEVLAKKIADENDNLRRNLLLEFEANITTNKGLTIDSEDYVRVTFEDADGILRLDENAVKEVGRDILNQNITKNTSILDGFNENSLTNPILKPEKLDAIVALSVDLQKKAPDAFDPKKSVIRNIIDLTIDKDIVGDQELIDMLNKYGLSFEDYVLTVAGSASDAGRVLQKFSVIRKKSKTITDKEIDADKKWLEAQEDWYKIARRVENARRGGIVSQIATAARNLQSAGIRAPLDALANVMDTAIWKYQDEIAQSNGFAGTAFNASLPYKAAFQLVSPNNWKNSFRQLNLMLTDPVNSVDIAKLILDRPEYGNKFESMFVRLNEIKGSMGRGEGGFKNKIKKGKVTDAFLSEYEDIVNVLNVPNRWQEHILRSTYFLGDMERIIKREWGVDLVKELENGKLLDFMNDSSEFRPKGARSFNEIIEESTYSALDATYANRPNNFVLKAFVDITTKSVIGTAALPFPNFIAKSMELIASYVPGTALVRRPKNNPMYKVLRQVLSGGKAEGGKLLRSDRRIVANNLVGLATLYGAYEYRQSESAPVSYKEMKLDEDSVVDITPQFPLRQIYWIVEAYDNLKQGTFETWIKSGIAETADTFLGSSIRLGTGNYFVDQVSSFVSDAFSGDTSGGPKGADRLAKTLAGTFGAWVNTLFVPYNQIQELERGFDLRPDTARETRKDPVTGIMPNMKQAFFKEIERTFTTPDAELAKPESERLFGTPIKKQSIISVFSGIKVTTPRDKEGDYLETLGFKDFKITSKDFSASGKRYEISEMKNYLKASVVPQLKIQEDKFKIKYRNILDPKFTEKFYIQTQMRPIAKMLFSTLREGVKTGRINAGGPFNAAMSKFNNMSLDNRKLAIMTYKIKNNTDVIDWNDPKTYEKLTNIIKKSDSALEKIKQRILKNLPN